MTEACSRWQGEYAVDQSWESSSIVNQITEWKFLVEAESLINHVNIRVRINADRLEHRATTSTLSARLLQRKGNNHQLPDGLRRNWLRATVWQHHEQRHGLPDYLAQTRITKLRFQNALYVICTTIISR